MSLQRNGVKRPILHFRALDKYARAPRRRPIRRKNLITYVYRASPWGRGLHDARGGSFNRFFR